ncbi:DUF1722 domain-containing protein [Lipingzhangella sp. LS1_29]|uniref:DUF1722 domain-containing protein n=1 Tax=Lipingzhangella rawalii TaxID=2055835 RepID=A0ABU2H7U5_9ACTN|nr:DUF1722 domain-containing protein [Lipingzhangella rawalii]MDS1270890.1 DUF1722 domain-containing protein [Lipingzhangella rawalii]
MIRQVFSGHPRPRLELRLDPTAAEPLEAELDQHVDIVALGTRHGCPTHRDRAPDGLVLEGADDLATDTGAGDPPMATRQQLRDPWLREHFVERLFARARVREMLAGGAGTADVMEFHSRHKLQCMAHDPAGCRALGRIAASAHEAPAAALVAYRDRFAHTLACPASPGRHVNAVQHALGMVDTQLSRGQRTRIDATLAAYRSGSVPLAVPLELVRELCAPLEAPWVNKQTYLSPYPPKLRLRERLYAYQEW